MWEIRTAEPSDLPALSALAERIFRDTFGPHNTAEDMDLYCAQAMSQEAMAEALDDPRTLLLVAAHDGALVAYAHLYHGDPVPEVTGESPIELKRFYVLASQHGSGLAQALMRAVATHSVRLGARTLWLNVWEHNPRAISFYRKLGFTEVGEQPFLLGTDLQRDLTMTIPIERIHP